MNTPEPSSQAWDRQQQGVYPAGQPPREKNMQYPPTFPRQMAQDQGYPPYTPPNSPPSSWNGSGGIANGAGNFGMPQTGRLNSSYQPPSTPGNPWANGTNTTGGSNGPNGLSFPNTPIPPSYTSPLNAKPPRRNTSRMGKILLFLGLALLLVMAGTTGVYLLNGSSPTSSSIAQPTAQPTPTPSVHMQHQQIATQYVTNMSLDDEIAQLLMVEHYNASYSPDLDIMINQQHIGAVILYKTAVVTRPQVQNETSSMQSHAKTPLFISIDEEGRSLHRLSDLYGGNPNYRKDADDIQATGNPKVATTEGESVAKDLLSLGINMNLAPVVDISDSTGYIGFDGRSFGNTADQVIKYAGPYLKAMQAAGVVGTVKHFPGLGSIKRSSDPHATLPTYLGTKEQLYQNDIVPFKHFIQSRDPYEQAYVIMPTDMLVPPIDAKYPVELSRTFITDILRNELGFKGVILTDSLHMEGVIVNGHKLSLAEACVLALQAGNDILEGASTSTEVETIITAVKDAVQSGQLTKEQIDAAVIRVLTLKMDFNIMPATLTPSSVTPTATATQG